MATGGPPFAAGATSPDYCPAAAAATSLAAVSLVFMQFLTLVVRAIFACVVALRARTFLRLSRSLNTEYRVSCSPRRYSGERRGLALGLGMYFDRKNSNKLANNSRRSNQ